MLMGYLLIALPHWSEEYKIHAKANGSTLFSCAPIHHSAHPLRPAQSAEWSIFSAVTLGGKMFLSVLDGSTLALNHSNACSVLINLFFETRGYLLVVQHSFIFAMRI